MNEPTPQHGQWHGHHNAWHYAENEKIPLEQLEPETKCEFSWSWIIALGVVALIWATAVWLWRSA